MVFRFLIYSLKSIMLFFTQDNTVPSRTTYRRRIRPTWQTYMLLPGWRGKKNDTAADVVHHRILDFLKVWFNHLTHLRSSGLEQGSAWGFDVFRLATMSKHLVDKINRFYMAESNRDVLTMMSGFVQQGDSYFVPRTHIEIPFLEDNEFVTHIFPRYSTWVEEFESPRGDKNKIATRNFLYKILPCLACVIIQDAPYHLQKFPNSEFSRAFKGQVIIKHPEYAEYCRTAIQKAEEFAEARNSAATRDLNPATQ